MVTLEKTETPYFEEKDAWKEAWRHVDVEMRFSSFHRKASEGSPKE